MSLSRFASAMGDLSQRAAAGFVPARLGTVSSYDADAYAVKAILQPEGIETGWMPIVTMLAGQGWGVYAAPSVGDQCLMVFAEGDASVGVCVGFLPSDEDVPPRVEAGEVHLRAKDDEASVILKPGGQITSRGTWVHDGAFTASGDIKSDADIIDASDVPMRVLRQQYNTHGHQGVTLGGALTPPTNKPAE